MGGWRGMVAVAASLLVLAITGCGSSAHGDLDMGTLASQIKSSIRTGTNGYEWEDHVSSVSCTKTAALEASCALEADMAEGDEAGTYSETVTISANGESYEASTPTKSS